MKDYEEGSKSLKKILKKVSGLILVLVAITIFGIYSYNIQENSNSMLTSGSVVSATKIGWGVKREKDHKQPDLRQDKYRTYDKI